MFSAAIPLVLEAQHCAPNIAAEYLDDINCAIEFLKRVQSWSSIAKEAVNILENMTTPMGQS